MGNTHKKKVSEFEPASNTITMVGSNIGAASISTKSLFDIPCFEKCSTLSAQFPQYLYDSISIDMIVNPSNSDQVLVFSTPNIQSIVVYDITSNKAHKIEALLPMKLVTFLTRGAVTKDNIDSFQLGRVKVIKGINPDTIIVYGNMIYDDRIAWDSFYCVFDTQKLEWIDNHDKIDEKTLNLLSGNSLFTTKDTEIDIFSFCNNDFLFNFYSHLIHISKLNKQTQYPDETRRFTLNQSFYGHNMLRLNSKQENIIEYLIFGGSPSEPLRHGQFYKFRLKLSKCNPKDNMENRATRRKLRKLCIDNIIIQHKLIDVSKEWIQDTDMPNILRHNYFGKTNDHRVHNTFAFFVDNERYLLLIGGTDHYISNKDFDYDVDKSFHKIIYFDRDPMHRKWHIWKEWKPTDPKNAKMSRIYRGEAILVGEKNKSILLVPNPIKNTDLFCKLLLPQKSIEWTIERLIWIAFEKNDNNQTCYMAKLPKDIVFILLSFLRPHTMF